MRFRLGNPKLLEIRVEEFHPFWKRVELSGELSQKFLEILVLNFTLHFPASLSKQVITRRPPLSYLQGARHPLYKHLLPMHYTSEVFITFEEVQHQFDPLISIFLFVWLMLLEGFITGIHEEWSWILTLIDSRGIEKKHQKPDNAAYTHHNLASSIITTISTYYGTLYNTYHSLYCVCVELMWNFTFWPRK